MATDSHGPLTVDRLATGSGTPVLVVDFVQFSALRPLSEELGDRNGGHPIYRIDPVTDLMRDEGYRPLDSLVDGYTAACARYGLPGTRLTVVGYCSAAPLASHLAARLASAAEGPGSAPVTLVLVVPTWPDTEMITAGFDELRAELRAGLDAAPAPPLGLDRGTGDAVAERALRRMHRVLRQDLLAMAERNGIDPAATALTEMSARYHAWLGFLLAGRDVAARPWPAGVVTHVLAGDGTGRAGPLPDPGVTPEADPGVDPEADRGVDIVRLPVPDRDVLADDRLPERVLGYVTRAGSGSATGSGAAR